jgi:DNA-binding SARP family transcriptional activator
MLAQATRLDGDDSVELFRRSLALNRRLADDRMVAVELHNLGHVEIRQGEIDAAERHFAELARTQPVEDAYAAAMALLNGAAVAFGRGAYAQAEDELTQAEATLAEEGIEPAPDDRSELEWLRGKLADKGG